MLKELESNFSELEKRLIKVIKSYKELQGQYEELSKDYEVLKDKYEAEKKKSQELAEQEKKIKLYSALSGNPNHNRLMKNHINRLIKEVDFCIAELQNSGL